MEIEKSLIGHVLDKLHTRSVSLIIALVMVISGIYMCTKGIVEKGSINLKSSVVEGTIETGSLGLLVMFLGVIIILAALRRVHPHEGEEISVTIDGNEIKMKNLSKRKVDEVLGLIISSSHTDRNA